MPGKPPYFPFYVKDFAADDKVESMSTEQVGAYTLLLCKAWTQEPAGSVPDDDTVLAKWARLSLARWAKVKSGVMSAFHLASGRWHQKRMAAEFDKLASSLEKASERGTKGAAKRWSKHSSSNAQGIAPAYGSGSESGSSPLGLGERGKGKPAEPSGFAEFWRQYPRKQARPRAVKAWLALSPDEETQAAILAGVARMPPIPPHELQYCPHPASWLNARRWEDETQTQTGKVEPDALAGIREFVANGE